MRFFKQIVAYIKPIQGYGTIGMLQRTIVYSEWVLVLTVVLSIILQIFKGDDDGWLQFLENYAIGTACSVVIVIVITITQFVSERNTVFEEYYYSLLKLIIHLELAFSHKKEGNEELLKHQLDEVKNDLDNNCSLSRKLFWFNRKKQKQFFRVCTSTYTLDYAQLKDIHNLGINLNEDEFFNYKIESLMLIRMICDDIKIRIFEAYIPKPEERDNYDQL